MGRRPFAFLAAATAVVFAALTAGPAAGAATGSSAGRERYPADLSLAGHANHRRPLPGEVQEVRWTVRNHGSRPVTAVDLDATVPEVWRLQDDSGCARRDRGRLHCALGPLSRGESRTVRFELAVPPRPRLGFEDYRARTRFTVDGTGYDGPSAHMRVEVVRHR
ncbi:hypothetical protein AB0L06_08940 [Spirillospora sp. NPDC052269]